MKIFLALLIFASTQAFATKEAIEFNFKNEDVTKIIEVYSKASGQKFIIDPAVHGKASIFNSEPISYNEAFNQLSAALAVNHLGISTRDDVMVVLQARALQRSLIKVLTEPPPLKPERMSTLIITLKNRQAEDVNKQLRILSSSDGELVPYSATNQIVISDWSSNLIRIDQIIKELDRPLVKTKR